VKIKALTFIIPVIVLLTSTSFNQPAQACGPFFPNRFLLGGDKAVLRAAQPTFAYEIGRVSDQAGTLEQFTHVLPESNYSPWEQTIGLGQADLQNAIEPENWSDTKTTSVITGYQALRSTFNCYSYWMNERDLFLYPTSDPMLQWQDYLSNPNTYRCPLLDLSLAMVPEGIPDEFSLYLEGAVHYYLGDWTSARESWEAVLDLPARDRQYRSTWATFMLGKILMYPEPEKSADMFRMVRDMARDGYSDSLGLAHSTWLWEARAELVRKNYTFVINRYMDIYSEGDVSVLIPLRTAIRNLIVNDPQLLPDIATDDLARKVIGIYIVCHTSPGFERWAPSVYPEQAELWLDAIEDAGIVDAETIDLLAWASYQSGRIDLARRWLGRLETDNGLTLWLRAKLELRDGNLESAIEYLEEARDAFPTPEVWIGSNAGWMLDIPFFDDTTTVPYAQVQQELGAIHLRLDNFTDALDSFLRSGSWWDAAYIAERVLTPDELKAYVDENWPGPVTESDGMWWSWPTGEYDTYQDSMADFQESLPWGIRYILARRLTRIGRWQEAREYYTDNLRTSLDDYISDIRTGHNESLSDEERTDAFWSAAMTARHMGMELMGTELEPDFTVVAGAYEPFASSRFRSANDFEEISRELGWPWERYYEEHGSDGFTDFFPASESERARLAAHSAEVQPDKRFHYRYIAQDHAWDAINLMPDEDDETARRICIAGNWLRRFDPDTVYPFYQALIDRCGSTDPGIQAMTSGQLPEIEENP